jgi:hypothetical protein
MESSEEKKMEMKIEIQESTIKEAALLQAQKLAMSQASVMVQQYFRPDNQLLHHSKGVGYQIIEGHVNEILTSEDLTAKIKKIVDAEMDAMILEATRAAMQRKANKLANEAVSK